MVMRLLTGPKTQGEKPRTREGRHGEVWVCDEFKGRPDRLRWPEVPKNNFAKRGFAIGKNERSKMVRKSAEDQKGSRKRKSLCKVSRSPIFRRK